ncbi:hypothetical protein EIK77_000348 [Talaromyces pinophilus]|nr:hypothetical protein EIK77_000348 [Talaromyces pinophilus]
MATSFLQSVFYEGFDSQLKSQVQQQLLESLQLQSMPSEAEIDKMLEHSAKICSSVDVKEWESDETLQDFINRAFCPHTTDGLDTRFPNPYNLRNLSYIASIRAQWTYDLSRHLLIYDDEDDSGLSIFST